MTHNSVKGRAPATKLWGRKHGDDKLNRYQSLLGTQDSYVEPPKPPRKPKVSTFVVGALALGAMALGAASGGLGGALIFLAIFAALTGLYVVVTGRRSWARLPSSRKVGGVVLAASLVLFVVGGITLPPRSAESIAAEAASANEKRAAEEAPALLPHRRRLPRPPLPQRHRRRTRGNRWTPTGLRNSPKASATQPRRSNQPTQRRQSISSPICPSRNPRRRRATMTASSSARRGQMSTGTGATLGTTYSSET